MLDIRSCDINADEFKNLITIQRQDKISAYKLEQDKKTGLAVELLLACGLRAIAEPRGDVASHSTGASGITLPLDIRAHEGGKLYTPVKVPGHPQVHFNFSHSQDIAVCAVSDHSVGIDVEHIGEREVLGEKRILSPEEYAEYERLDGRAKKELFYEFWVMKESYLKALGMGLTIRPGDVSVKDGVVKTKDKSLENRYLRMCTPDSIRGEYKMCICTQKPERIRIRQLNRTDLESLRH